MSWRPLPTFPFIEVEPNFRIDSEEMADGAYLVTLTQPVHRACFAGLVPLMTLPGHE